MDDNNDEVGDNDNIARDGGWDILQDLNCELLFNDWASASTSNLAYNDTPLKSNTFAKLFIDAIKELY